MTATSPSPDRYPTPVSSLSPHPPVIALLTDFGLQDAYVGIMKGVILDICPKATLVDKLKADHGQKASKNAAGEARAV